MDDRELFRTLLQVLSYLSLLLQLGIGILAFMRFKATLSGILVGGGSVAVALFSGVFRAITAVMRDTASPADDVFLAVGAARSVLLTVLTLVVAVGIAMIPSSLQKLAARSQ
jgi:hypothetical protein